jgi:hypothetical protein
MKLISSRDSIFLTHSDIHGYGSPEGAFVYGRNNLAHPGSEAYFRLVRIPFAAVMDQLWGDPSIQHQSVGAFHFDGSAKLSRISVVRSDDGFVMWLWFNTATGWR